MEVDAIPKRTNDHFKNATIDAQAQEAAFLADVAAHSEADLGLVKIALELIKWYHGPSERKSGEPFYLHPLAVAQIVLDYDQDEATIIGATAARYCQRHTYALTAHRGGVWEGDC